MSKRSSYKKRIASWKTTDGKAISLWVEKENSIPIAWSVYFHYRHLFKFSSEAPARTKCLEIYANDGFDYRPPDSLRSKAEFIDHNPSVAFTEDLMLGLLVELEIRASTDKGLSSVRIGMRRTLSQRLAGMEPIPKDNRAAEKWVSDLCEVLKDAFKTQGTFTSRISLLLKILEVINQYPAVFAKWAGALIVIKARLKSFMLRKRGGLVKEENREPYSLQAIRSLLDAQNSFESVCLILAYLQYGFRANEAERLTPDCGRTGLLELSKVVTKNKTNKKPPLFMLTRCILKAIDLGHVTLNVELNDVDRKRLRPTAVVMLTLAGQDVLSIIQRTGHSDVRMLVSHYAKFLPADYRIGQTFNQYLGIDGMTIGGKKIAECLWDQWLLSEALVRSSALGADWFVMLVKESNQDAVGEQNQKLLNF